MTIPGATAPTGGPALPVEDVEALQAFLDEQGISGAPGTVETGTGLGFLGFENLTPVGLQRPPLYGATREVPFYQLRESPRGTPGRLYARRLTVEEPVIPSYFEYDQWAEFASKPGSYIAAVQAMMIRAGLREIGSVTPGHWSVDDAQVMASVLVEANASGKTWAQVLSIYEQFRPRDDQAGARFTADPYLAPDYASLSQSVRSAFAAEVGREPHDWEVELLASQLSADARREYEARTAAQRLDFEARNVGGDEGNRRILAGGSATVQGFIGGPGAEDAVGGSAGGGTVQQVDPLARLAETIRARYAPEVEAEQKEQETAVNLAALFSNLAGLEQAVR
jgi:hypothetical protein